MTKSLKRLLLLLLIIQGNLLFSQQKDAGLWMSVNLEKKITKSVAVHFSEEIRMYENMTEVSTVFSQIGLEYRPFNRFRISADYRFSLRKKLNDTYGNRNSFLIDLTYREKIKPLTLFVRARFQSVFTDLYFLTEGTQPEYYLRTRITMKLDLVKNLKPYLSAETFFNMDDPGRASFDQVRFCAGVEYSFNRMHMIDLYYMIRKEYNIRYPDTDFIVGIGYYLTLPDFKTFQKK